MKFSINKLINSTISILTIKRNKMTTDVQKLQKIYVWTKSEKAGTIVRISEEQADKKWLYFTDGSRINPTLVKEYLIEAKDEDDATKLAESFGNVLGIGANTNINTDKVQQTTRRITDGKSAPTPEVNVMMEMLKKMSTKNQAEMPVLVNIPSSIVYEMLQDQMDLEVEDLNEQIGLLIENQINNLQDQLRSQIKSFIIKYYENE